jgi:DNA topoisomerase I
MKHIAQICNEFFKLAKTAKTWWEGKSFTHPSTKNRVKFKSLPIEEQRRLNALYAKKQNEEDQTKIDGNKSDDDKTQRAKLKAELQRQKLQQREEKKQKRKEQETAYRTMTPESHPNFFTKTGQRLNTTKGLLPGIDFTVNEKWDPKTDNCYYCVQHDPKTGRPQHFYTEDYIKKHDKIKFANNERFGELLPNIRKKYTALLHSNDERDRVYSTAIALVDQCAMRIGNKGSEENDVRGLHNLQTKHMKITGNTVNLHYIGKTSKEQNHTFNVDDTVKDNLEKLISGKGPEDPIFTWNKRGESVRIAPTFANRFLRRKLGSNVSIHHFRHYYGTKTADEYLKEIDTSKLSPNQLSKAVREATVLASEFLGNTPNVARKHYIDPTVFQMFYKRAGVKMPKASTINMSKTAAKFSFNVSSTLEGLTPQEQEFKNKLFETVLEDLPEIDENDNVINS